MTWRSGMQKLLRSLFGKGARKETDDNPGSPAPPRTQQTGQRLTRDVEQDIQRIESAFGQTNEFVVRRFEETDGKRAAVVFIDGLVMTPSIAEFIIAPLINETWSDHPTPADQQPIESIEQTITALTYGKCVLLRHGRQATAFDVHHWEKRAVGRAEIEPSEIGSQEGFVEDLFTNVVLLRRRLRTAKLQTERLTVGTVSPTDVRLVYVADIAREALVEEVRGRVKEIDIDTVVGPNVLAEMTSDTPWSPFPNGTITARPDRAAAMLGEGYIALLTDGSPMVLVVPGTLGTMFQAADDYYDNYYIGSFTRLVRWLAAFIGLLASALYVSVISYHHEIIPSRLLFTIAAGREGIPFPPVMEAFLMELAFELLREAGLRVPSQIGQAVSIVGVLVIGDAAVRAGLVSPLMIVVVGMTAISTFAVPSNQLANSLRLLRFPLIALAGFLGLFGVFFGLLLLSAIVISSRSFGVPYMTPFVPIWRKGLIDGMIRGPMWLQRHRPWHLVNPESLRQQPPGQMPQPESQQKEEDSR